MKSSILGDNELDVVTGGGSSLIVKSGIEVAGGVVTVDGELDGGAGGLGAPELLADEERLTGGGDAVGLEVDVDDSVSSSGPRASDGNASGEGIDSLDAGEALDVTGGISLGIGGGGGKGDDGRVGGPNADSGVDSGNPGVVGGGRLEGGDVDSRNGRGVDGGGRSSDGRLHINAVEVEDIVCGVAPKKAGGDDLVGAGVGEAGHRRRLRISRGGSSSSGDGARPRVGDGSRSGPGAARGPGVGVGP